MEIQTKKCSKCGVEKELSEFGFKYDALNSRCKSCINEDQMIRRRANGVPPRGNKSIEALLNNEKICFKCKVSKKLDEFYLSKDTKDGRYSSCIPCTRLYIKSWHRTRGMRRLGVTGDISFLTGYKKCKLCGTYKPHGEFYRNEVTTDKLSSYCIPCDKVKGEDYRRAHGCKRRGHKSEIEILLGLKKCNGCGVFLPFDRYHKSKTNNTGVSPRCKTCTFEKHLIERYGIDLETYAWMLHAQNFKCALCKEVELGVGKIGGAAVDHCHTTNITRDILCFSCNVALGGFKDNQHLLRKAAKYLEEHQ